VSKPDSSVRAGPQVAVDRTDVQKLLDAAVRLESCAEVSDLVVTAARLARAMTASTVVSLGRVDQDTFRAMTVDPPIHEGAWTGLAASEYRASRRPALRALIRDRRGWVVDTNNPDSDQTEIEALLANGMSVAVAVPVLAHGSVWGQLYLARREQVPYTSDEVALLEVFANLVAGALTRIDIASQVERLVMADPLTGLPNRRAADSAVAAALASGAVTCVVMCDVDSLKRINDEHGHERGDELLRSVADVVRRMRDALPGSTAVRLGGDEFCVITVGIPSADVRVVVEAELAVGGLPYDATLSYGIASTEHTDPEATGRSLFRLADAAQYRAKRARHPRASGGSRYGGITQLTVLDDGLAVLDALTRDARARDVPTHAGDRLSAVAAALTEAVGAMHWYVSSCEPQSRSLRLVSRGNSFSRPDTAFLTDAFGQDFASPLNQSTARALDGGAFWVHVSDPDGHPHERHLLAATDATAVVAAGGPDASGRRWLVELYFDNLHVDVEYIATPVRAVVAAAIVGVP